MEGAGHGQVIEQGVPGAKSRSVGSCGSHIRQQEPGRPLKSRLKLDLQAGQGERAGRVQGDQKPGIGTDLKNLTVLRDRDLPAVRQDSGTASGR